MTILFELQISHHRVLKQSAP